MNINNLNFLSTDIIIFIVIGLFIVGLVIIVVKLIKDKRYHLRDIFMTNLLNKGNKKVSQNNDKYIKKGKEILNKSENIFHKNPNKLDIASKNTEVHLVNINNNIYNLFKVAEKLSEKIAAYLSGYYSNTNTSSVSDIVTRLANSVEERIDKSLHESIKIFDFYEKQLTEKFHDLEKIFDYGERTNTEFEKKLEELLSDIEKTISKKEINEGTNNIIVRAVLESVSSKIKEEFVSINSSVTKIENKLSKKIDALDEELRPIKRQMLQRATFKNKKENEWVSLLLNYKISENERNLLESGSLFLESLDPNSENYASAFRYVTTSMGNIFFNFINRLDEKSHDYIIKLTEDWFESRKFKYSIYIPRKGDGYDSKIHLPNEQDVQYSNSNLSVNSVLCWGLKETGPNDQISSKARVNLVKY